MGSTSVLPFCDHYRAEGIWLTQTPPHDETQKNIPAKNLPLESDIYKNSIGSKRIECFYLPKTWYEYQEKLFLLRSEMLSFISFLSKKVEDMLKGKIYRIDWGSEQLLLIERIDELIRYFPDHPQLASEKLKNDFKTYSDWITNFHNFFQQIIKYIQSEFSDENMGRLSVINIKDFSDKLKQIHSTDTLFLGGVSDYFGISKLSAKEKNRYHVFAELIDFWLNNKGVTFKPA